MGAVCKGTHVTDQDQRTQDQRTVEYRGSGFYVSVLMILLIGLILLVFALQNTADVTVTLLGADFEVPLFGVAIGAGLVTLALDQLVGLVWRRQQRQRLEERMELTRLRAQNESSDDVDSSYRGDAVVDADTVAGSSDPDRYGSVSLPPTDQKPGTDQGDREDER
jgi:uncharacterized integral membrane protein